MRALAAGVWAARARVEDEAAARFRRLAVELSEVGAVAPVVAMARQASSDELRHADLCRALVRRFGGATLATPATAGANPPDVPAAAPRGLAPRERVLCEVVAMSCITETLSAALLGEMVERAADAEVRDAMQSILRDEIDHSRLGWAHLAAERERGVPDVLAPHLPAMLRGTVEEELFLTAPEPPRALVLAGLGALDRPTRLAVFTATLRDVVFPGLRRFGVDTGPGEHWLASKLPVA